MGADRFVSPLPPSCLPTYLIPPTQFRTLLPPSPSPHAGVQAGLGVYGSVGGGTADADPSIDTVSKDLEAFAKHAGRKTVTVDDVMLLGRRNEGLEAVLRAVVDGMRERGHGGSARGKGKGAAKG